MAKAVREGRKTVTTRTRSYGRAGDVLQSDAGPIVLDSVERVPLHFVRSRFWMQEGCSSPDDFVDVWVRLHPRRGWQPLKIVYLHRFHRLVEDAE